MIRIMCDLREFLPDAVEWPCEAGLRGNAHHHAPEIPVGPEALEDPAPDHGLGQFRLRPPLGQGCHGVMIGKLQSRTQRSNICREPNILEFVN